MTEEEMERLADKVVDKLVSKQKQLDQEFIKDLEASNVPIEVHERLGMREKIELEILQITNMLKWFEHREQYEEAAMCIEKLSYLRSELNKLQ
jgi:hypothetical protein